MTLLFIYNIENGELFCSQEYDGGEIPENGTLKVPPETEENETVVFENDEWEILKDYRFTHKMKKETGDKVEVKDIETLGDIPEGWELITLEEAAIIEEKIRIASLSMTKLDFYKFVLSPGGITYDELLNILSQNIELKATWDLCSRVYRGDSFLNRYIKQYITITDEELDEIFKEHGSEVSAESMEE